MHHNPIAVHYGGGFRRLAHLTNITITHGMGATLFDVHGRSYIDFVGGYGVASIGHAHPLWTEAIAEQASHLANAPYYNPQLQEYLDELALMLPESLCRLALFSGGSEAVECGIRLAQLATGKRNIVAFTGSYHGRTLACRFAGDRLQAEGELMRQEWTKSVPFPYCTLHDASIYNECDEDGRYVLGLVRSLLSEDNDIAALLVEPVLGTDGNRPPCRRFLSELAALCAAQSVCCIFDESITGFYRLGVDFAMTFFDSSPDILVLGKGIGGGYPLSGIAARAELWDRAGFCQPSSTSTSFGASPLAAAAGRATLRVLVDEIGRGAKVRQISDVLIAGLARIAEATGLISPPRGIGLLLGFDVIERSADQLVVAMAERGVLLAPAGNAIRLQPPLVLTLDQVKLFLELLEATLVESVVVT